MFPRSVPPGVPVGGVGWVSGIVSGIYGVYLEGTRLKRQRAITSLKSAYTLVNVVIQPSWDLDLATYLPHEPERRQCNIQIQIIICIRSEYEYEPGRMRTNQISQIRSGHIREYEY